MSTNCIIILSIAIILTVGLIRIAIVRSRLLKRITFLEKFKAQFDTLATDYFSHGYHAARQVDPSLYGWLIANANIGQQSLASYGIGECISSNKYFNFSRPLSLVIAIRMFGTNTIRQNDAIKVGDEILSSLGYFDQLIEELNKDLKNPVKWFQYGFRYLLSLPFRTLQWFGIIEELTLNKLVDNRIYKVISGIIGLIGLASSIISIVTGWNLFLKILKL